MKLTIAIASTLLACSLMSSASAAQLAAVGERASIPTQQPHASSDGAILLVGWRDGWHRHDPYRDGWHRHYHHGWAPPLGGLAAGAIAGAAIASSHAQASANAYCEQKYKSFDPASGTYLGYDGERHPCP